MCVVVCSVFATLITNFLLFIFPIFLALEFSTLVLLTHLHLNSAPTSSPSLLCSSFPLCGLLPISVDPFLLLFSLFSLLLLSLLCLFTWRSSWFGSPSTEQSRWKIANTEFLFFSITLLNGGLGAAVIRQYTEMSKILCKVHQILSC